MALHQAIKRALLVGAHLDIPPAPAPVPPPSALKPLVEVVASEHRRFNVLAIEHGHRYRSAFWSIYLLSAAAVLCAVLPFALGWNDPSHALHRYAGLWGVLEVAIIAGVAVIYWRGHRDKWQAQWLAARTRAELVWYLPLIAPLIPPAPTPGPENWYLRLFEPGADLRSADDIAALCARSERLAHESLGDAPWSDPAFVAAYSRWAIGILDEQRHYQRSVMIRERALRHRVHRLTTWLFGLTAAGAAGHFVLHLPWLLITTTFFPALGAALHGALAQSESYRLEVAAERLQNDLGRAIEQIAQHLGAEPRADVVSLQTSVRSALALLLDEHQDWHMLVRPHHLALV
jgi:hypothetical protein